MTTEISTLLDSLPDGRASYVRDTDHNGWGVAIFATGGAQMLVRVASGMDKGVACWMADAINAARPDKFGAGAPAPTMEIQPVGVPEPIFEARMCSAVYRMLATSGIVHVDGPPQASFDWQGERVFGRTTYRAFAIGVRGGAHGHHNSGRTDVPGRFTDYPELEAAAMAVLAVAINAGRFVIWRARPQVIRERGFLKAYMRFAVTTNPEVIDAIAQGAVR